MVEGWRGMKKETNYDDGKSIKNCDARLLFRNYALFYRFVRGICNYFCGDAGELPGGEGGFGLGRSFGTGLFSG